MTKLAGGDRAMVPHMLLVHLIAARYGTTPAKVRDWPIDDFMHASKFLGVTGGR